MIEKPAGRGVVSRGAFLEGFAQFGEGLATQSARRR
jgi:hypothetical protein